MPLRLMSKIRPVWRTSVVVVFAMLIWIAAGIQPPSEPAEATFPGTNGKIMFFLSGPETDAGIYTVDADGSGQAQVIDGVENTDPAWSADGQSLAFTRTVFGGGGANPSSSIWLANADGTNQRQLTTGVHATEPTWSADGTQIAFRRPDGISIADVATGAATELTAMIGTPEWSPDGARIAVLGVSLFLVTLDGAVSELANGLTNGVSPSWSPDGTEIALFRFPVSSATRELVAVSVEDGSVRAVRSDPVVGSPNGLAWSPEGDRLAYTNFDLVSSGVHIYAENADGSGGVQQITSGPGSKFSLDWQPLPQHIDSVEFTQAIQELQTVSALKASLGNGQPPVPIVAGKPAAMRIYADQVEETTSLTFEVSGVINGSEAVTLEPACTPEKRRKQEDGCLSVDFYFTPPEGQWSIDLTVRMVGQIVEEHSFQLTSKESDALVLKAVSVCHEKNPGFFGTWECEEASKLGPLVSLLRKIAPTDDVQVLMGGTVSQDIFDFTSSAAWFHQVARDIHDLHGVSDGITQAVLGQEIYYHGMVRPVIPDLLGMANDIPSRGAASVTSYPDLGPEGAPWVVAHETGHMLGLRHTNSSVPLAAPGAAPGCWLGSDPASTWPYPSNELRSAAAPGTQEVGYDVATKTALPGGSFFDLIGYCVAVPPAGASDDVAWISPHSALRLLSPTGPLAVSQVLSSSTGADSFLLISGTIENESVAFSPIFQIDSPGEAKAGAGTHRIEVRGAGGAVLYTHLFSPTHTHISVEAGEVPNSAPFFGEMVPIQEGAESILVFNTFDDMIGLIELTGEVPTVGMTTAAGATAEGALTFEWSVEDPDSAEHTFWVDYSADGGVTWANQAMAHEEPGLALDLSRLAGSDTSMIRVIASDGVNTGMVISEPFSVPKKLPAADLFFPEDGSTYRTGDLVWLQGSAFDVDDGFLNDDSIQWDSSEDGALGSGDDLAVYDLSPGMHTITLTASDGDGNEALDSITVTVSDGPLIEGAGLAGDVDCNGVVNSVDGLKILQTAAGLPVQQTQPCPQIGSGDPPFGDVNCDGATGAGDALFVLRFVAALPVNLPPGCPQIGVRKRCRRVIRLEWSKYSAV